MFEAFIDIRLENIAYICLQNDITTNLLYGKDR